MANELKQLIVKEMVSRYRNTHNYLVVNYQGIKSLEFDQLRKDMHKKNIYLEIVKNSLAAIAFREMGMPEIANILTGPSAIVTGEDDPVVLAKEVAEWSKKISLLSLRGGFVDNAMLSTDDIESLAKLPTLPVLHTQIVTSINTPIVGVVSAFNSVLRSIATVLQAVKDQKEKNKG
jgi:large subunit ribosomal protein L10